MTPCLVVAMVHDQLVDYDYIKRAVERIKAGEISSDSGSHIMGVFGKAASKFENIIKAETSRLIEAWGLDYDRDIKNSIRGALAFEGLTLGQCCAALKEASRLRPGGSSDFVPGIGGFENILRQVSAINQTWVQLKHRNGTEVPVALLVAGLESMSAVLQGLREHSPVKPDRGTPGTACQSI